MIIGVRIVAELAKAGKTVPIPFVFPTLPTPPTQRIFVLNEIVNFNLVGKAFIKPLVLMLLLEHFIEELNSVVVDLICGKPCRGVGQICVINKQSCLLLCLFEIIYLTGIVHPHSGLPRNVLETVGRPRQSMREKLGMLET